MSSRDPWLDNAKMTLITLAVLGHSWGLLAQSPINSQVYDFLYVWHMPAFVFLSGYVSRRYSWSGARLWQTVRTLVVPYLVFEAAIAWFSIQVGGEHPTDLFLYPLWPLWYLCALVLWRLAAPAFLRVPWPVALIASVAVSLAGGLVDYPFFDVSRALGLLPFFVLGLVITPAVLEQVRTPALRFVGVAALVITWFQVRSIDEWANTYWLYYRSYDYIGATDAYGMTGRAVLLGTALLCSIGVLSLVPRAGGWFSRMGAATMVVFLFHGFVVRLVDYAGFADWAAQHTTLAPYVVLVGAIALTMGLAAPPVVRVLEHLVDPVAWAQMHTRGAVELSMAVTEHERMGQVRVADPDPDAELDPTRVPAAAR